MNAVVLAHGLARAHADGKRGQDAREVARAALSRFWDGVGVLGTFMSGLPLPATQAMASWFTQWITPAQANPLGLNPLRQLLERDVDFELLARQRQLKVFVCATNVRTGRGEIFSGKRLSSDAVMASACLPALFQPVKIDDEHYWDGGYSGNPPIYPLLYGTDCEDVLIVQINPINIESVPRTASEIVDRVNELSFNSTLMREMRAIHFVSKLLDEHRVERGRYKRLNIHTVEAEAELARLGSSSKVNADKDFLGWLFDLGRERCARFLDAHYEKIGVESSTDVGAKFL